MDERMDFYNPAGGLLHAAAFRVQMEFRVTPVSNSGKLQRLRPVRVLHRTRTARATVFLLGVNDSFISFDSIIVNELPFSSVKQMIMPTTNTLRCFRMPNEALFASDLKAHRASQVEIHVARRWRKRKQLLSNANWCKA